MKAQDYSERKDELSGWPVKIVSYRLGQKFFVTIHNEQPGAWVAKAEGATLEEAESQARKVAAERLAKTRKTPPSTGGSSGAGS